MPDFLFMPGSKAVISEDGIASGWLAPYGGPVRGGKDLQGESFEPGATDFALDYYSAFPVLYAHGRDDGLRGSKVGDAPVKELRDKGVWVEAQLNKQHEYYDALRALSEKGDLFWSSGAISHLVEKDGRTGVIKNWPIAEATLTMTPANPWATASIKEADWQEMTVTPANPDATVKETPASTALAVTWTFDPDAIKEGRRNSTSDQQIVQTMHDHAVALGATCSSDDSGESDTEGKEAPTPPANVLTIKAGDDVEQPTASELDAVKALLMDVARSEAARLVG